MVDDLFRGFPTSVLWGPTSGLWRSRLPSADGCRYRSHSWVIRRCFSDSRPVCLQSHASVQRSDVGPNINQHPATTNHTLTVSPRGFLWGFQMIQFKKFPCCYSKDEQWNHTFEEGPQLEFLSLFEWGTNVLLLFVLCLDFNCFFHRCSCFSKRWS